MKPRHTQKKPRTKEERKTALLQVLVFRRSIDDLDAADLARLHGVPVETVIPMLEGERLRRMMRA